MSTNTSFAKVRSIWISDIHLGSCGTQLSKLQSFLEQLSCETLFLNGDTIDKWVLKKRDLKEKYNHILTALDILKQKGISLVFLTGNHDSKRDIENIFNDVYCVEQCHYKTLNNKSYLV